VRQRGLSLALLALALSGCGKAKEEPTPGPSAAAPAPEPRSFDAPASPAPRPLAVGQWARLRLVRPAEPPSRVTFRVTGKEGDAHWVEVESNTPRGTVVIGALVGEEARKGLTRSAVRKVKIMRGEGASEELTGPAIDAAYPLVEEHLGAIGQPDVGESERADVKVPAGAFAGCYLRSIERAGTDPGTKTKIWTHPAVPVIGFARAEGTAGKRFTMELLEMGEDGAKSAF
jgi:hypothetical protein